MSQSHIVDEVRSIREALAAENNFDLGAIFTMLKRVGLESGKPHVHFAPRRFDATAAAQQAPAADESHHSPLPTPSSPRR